MTPSTRCNRMLLLNRNINMNRLVSSSKRSRFPTAPTHLTPPTSRILNGNIQSIRSYASSSSSSTSSQSSSTSTSTNYNPPKTGVNPAYDLSLQYLDQQRHLIDSQLKNLESQIQQSQNTNDSTKLQDLLQKHFELSLSKESMTLEPHFFLQLHVRNPKKHPLDLSSPLYRRLRKCHYDRYVVPSLLKSANEMDIVGDAFPKALEPSVMVELLFEKEKDGSSTVKKVYPGDYIGTEETMSSPQLTILPTPTPSSTEKYYTVMLTDMDYPNLTTSEYREWCQWLLVNVPIQDALTIPSTPSPYLSDTPSNLPGDVILPYVPPHPNKSKPNKSHRYLLTIMEQPSGKLDSTKILPTLTTRADSFRLENQKLNQLKESWEKTFEGPGEKNIMYMERFQMGSTWAFAKEFGLDIVGYSMFRNEWRMNTSEIFTALNLHEPVISPQPKLLEAFAKKTVKIVEKVTITGENQMKTPIKDKKPAPKLLTKRDLEIRELEKVRLERLAKASAKKKGPAVVVNTEKSKKEPRVGVLAVTALVKSKKGDIAGQVDGKVTSRVRKML